MFDENRPLNKNESLSDVEIVKLVLAGQRDQFGLIVRRYFHPLLRLAHSRTGNESASEDIVQETFLCALKSLHTYKPQFGFRTWLWTILLNQCRRHYSQQQRRGRVGNWSDHTDQSDCVDERLETPLTHLLSDERRELLRQVLLELPAPMADALRLRFFGGLRFQEIADVMECGLSTAKHRVRTGLVRMSDLISKTPLGEKKDDLETKHEL